MVMTKENIYVGGGNYNPPVLMPVAFQQSRAIMATSMEGGSATITNWYMDDNDQGEY